MPSDETRRVLKVFGVAVTNYEDAVESGATAEEINKAEAEVNVGLREVNALIERVRAKKSTRS
jgi:ABC-type proline/glycine betaine transport system ATPase subunit